MWCKIGRIFPDGHSYFRTNKGSFRNSGAPPSAGCKRRRLKSRMTDSRLMLLSTPAGQCFPSLNSTATASRGSVRETATCRTDCVRKWVWYGRGRVCRTKSLHTAPGPAVTSAATSATPSPGSHFRSPGPRQPLPQPRAQQPLPQPRAQQPLPQPGPQCQSHAVQKTGPILYRRLLQTGYRTLSVPQ